jgi:hypothetical protein
MSYHYGYPLYFLAYLLRGVPGAIRLCEPLLCRRAAENPC